VINSNLRPEQRQKLQLALLDAFRDKSSLQQMFSFKLDKNLDTIAEGASLKDIVFNVIQTAEAEGWIENLVRAARQSNNGNLNLKIIAEELFSSRIADNKLKNSLNPFIPLYGKTDDEKLFFSGLREFNRVFEHLNSGSNVVLIGKEGVGKSSLLWAIYNKSATRLNLPRQAVILDLNEISDSEDDFYEALCNEIGIPDCRGNPLNRNLRDKRILLAIDNVGKLAWKGFTRQVRDWLRSKAEGMNSPLRLVLAASSPLEDLFQDSQNTSPLAGICQTENIGFWSEETIRSFITLRLQNTNVKNFEESDILEIIQSSRGHPRQLMRLCNQTYDQYIQRT
jgi:GTPase SAR1 family protein